jgi:hypothetical protein
MTDIISKDQYEKWAREIASKIDVGKIMEVGKMTTKKKKSNLGQTIDMAIDKKADSFWHHKTFEELANEQDIKPVKDEADFMSRYWGGLEDWDDIDEFLKEVRG